MTESNEQFATEIIAALGAYDAGTLATALEHLHVALEAQFEPELAHIVAQGESALEEGRPFDLRAHVGPLCPQFGVDLSNSALVTTEELNGGDDFFGDELILDFDDAFDSVDEARHEAVETTEPAEVAPKPVARGEIGAPSRTSSNDFSDLFDLDSDEEDDGLPAPGGEVASALFNVDPSEGSGELIPSESGLHLVRKARYAGVAPPPPAHRRGAPSGSGVRTLPEQEPPPEPEMDDGDDDWDFGFGAPTGADASLLDDASQQEAHPAHLDIEPEVQRSGGSAMGSHLDIEPEVQRSGGSAMGSHLDIEPEVQRSGGSAMSSHLDIEPKVQSASAARPSSDAQEVVTDRVPQQGVRHRGRTKRDEHEQRTRPVEAVPSTPSPSAPSDGLGVSPAADAPDTLRVPMQARRGGGDPPQRDGLAEARALAYRGEFEAALDICKSVLAEDPGHAEARSLMRAYAQRLDAERRTTLEPLTRVPRVNTDMLPNAGAILNPRSMFLLSMVDGAASLQDLIDISGLPSSEATDILLNMVEADLLEFG